MTPEEKRVILVATRRHRGWMTDDDLSVAVQALMVSRQPIEGPAPFPCGAKARHSKTLTCEMHVGHENADGSERRDYGWGEVTVVHRGTTVNGSVCRFKTYEKVAP